MQQVFSPESSHISLVLSDPSVQRKSKEAKKDLFAVSFAFLHGGGCRLDFTALFPSRSTIFFSLLCLRRTLFQACSQAGKCNDKFHAVPPNFVPLKMEQSICVCSISDRSLSCSPVERSKPNRTLPREWCFAGFYDKYDSLLGTDVFLTEQ